MSVKLVAQRTAQSRRKCAAGDHRDCTGGRHYDAATERAAVAAARQERAFESYRLPSVYATVEQMRTFSVDELRELYRALQPMLSAYADEPTLIAAVETALGRIVEAAKR